MKMFGAALLIGVFMSIVAFGLASAEVVGLENQWYAFGPLALALTAGIGYLVGLKIMNLVVGAAGVAALLVAVSSQAYLAILGEEFTTLWFGGTSQILHFTRLNLGYVIAATMLLIYLASRYAQSSVRAASLASE